MTTREMSKYPFDVSLNPDEAYLLRAYYRLKDGTYSSMFLPSETRPAHKIGGEYEWLLPEGYPIPMEDSPMSDSEDDSNTIKLHGRNRLIWGNNGPVFTGSNLGGFSAFGFAQPGVSWISDDRTGNTNKLLDAFDNTLLTPVDKYERNIRKNYANVAGKQTNRYRDIVLPDNLQTANGLPFNFEDDDTVYDRLVHHMLSYATPDKSNGAFDPYDKGKFTKALDKEAYDIAMELQNVPSASIPFILKKHRLDDNDVNEAFNGLLSAYDTNNIKRVLRDHPLEVSRALIPAVAHRFSKQRVLMHRPGVRIVLCAAPLSSLVTTDKVISDGTDSHRDFLEEIRWRKIRLLGEIKDAYKRGYYYYYLRNNGESGKDAFEKAYKLQKGMKSGTMPSDANLKYIYNDMCNCYSNLCKQNNIANSIKEFGQ